VQLEESLDKYTDAGLGVVAISYDSVDILKSFSDRMGGFRYPMLADPDSEIIETYGIRNPNPAPGSRTDGMAFPGTYIVNTDGIVQEKFFEDSHRIRPTAETVLMKTFGADGGRRTEVQLPQFNFAAYASQDNWRPGNTVVLVTDFDLPELMHLYAPGSDYTAVNLSVVETEFVRQGRLDLPEAEILYLEPIDESVPVYHGTPQIQREVSLSPAYREETIAVDAILTYQTCDDEICFPPADFELTFNFDVIQHDRQRAPEDVRHPGE
jgi:hypothetical protein